MDLGTLSLGAAFAGLLSHVFWFMHGEHDFLARQYCLLYGAFQAAGFFLMNRIAGASIFQSILAVQVVTWSFLTTVFSSMILYRVLFHRLRRFPGPFSWKVTKLSQVAANADSMGYKHLDNLHKKYGEFVRIGPQDLSVVHPSAAQVILGPGSKCKKAIWYDVGSPLVSMHQCRDKKIHDIRRRTWDKGFNAKSLRDYESRIGSYADVLLDQLRSFGGGKFNAAKWFNYYSFDVMGDLAFGAPFDMLKTGEKHFAIPLLEGGMEPMNVIPVAPWLFWIIAALPYLSEPYHKFIKWSEEQVERRKTMKLSEPDIMAHLLEAPPMSNDVAVNKNWEVGDSRLIIVAGSDTTAATLTYGVYELIKNPKALKALREDISKAVSGNSVDNMELQKCEFLNAFIDETLRLHPPVPSGLIRITPPEGITIGDTYIPGETHVQVPMYSLQRSPAAYELPDEFIPERWTTRPELIKQKGAWAPFSLGAFGCVGKGLAYMEIRTVLAKFVTQFDFDFAPGEDGSNLIDNTEDHFTLNLADMHITVKPRKQ